MMVTMYKMIIKLYDFILVNRGILLISPTFRL